MPNEPTPEPASPPSTPPKEEATKKPWFEVAMDQATKEWHWVLWSGNGRPMATNFITYPGPHEAVTAIMSFRETVNPKTAITVQKH